MRSPRYLPILLLMFSAITSCNKTSENTPAEIKTGSAEAYFQQALNSKEPSKMLVQFKKGLKSRKITNDTIKYYLLDGIIYSFNKLKEYDSSMAYSEKMIRQARINENTYFEALGYYRKAIIHQYLNNYKEQFRNAFKSRNLYLSIGDSLRAGKRSLEMANAQSSMSDYTGSQENATLALSLLQKTKDSSYISSALNQIGITNRERGFYQDAIANYESGLKYSTSTEDSLSFLNNMALAYRDNGNFSKAIDYLKLINSKTEYADKESHARFVDNLAYTEWLKDSTANVLVALRLSLEMRLKNNDLKGLTSSYNHLSDYYSNKDRVQAKEYAVLSLEAARKNDSKISELNALENLLSIVETGESEKYIRRYLHLNDSLKTGELKAKNFFAKIKFDEEQKQKEIDDLQANALKQQLESEELKSQTIILSLGGLLILVSSGFGFYYLKQRHEKEKIQETHLTETRISKKIHDELANDVYNVMSGMQEIASNDIMDKLDHIYKRTRNISRENSSIPMGDNYLPHLISTLSSSLPENTRLILRGEENINWSKLSPEKKIVLYRVLQEMMINMNKHSQASLVAIIFSEEKNLLKIQYSDNGVGLSKESLKSGNGIQNMENRIFSIKGKLNFETEQEKGLKILIQIPI
ncbi:ATP-binding protein [Autumnicola edwardsiae]|uniref:histidine kinase n=1 Tax=Autumnicola edwardsiae TaxID=3075594 RepID=A0ABU3CUT5_9FLAO|nr:ATP-binding protein [Zunongwangia sp. F297]MDT0650109.1 ATP-binding protein [Zunongwangia sp. F297]